MHERDEQYHVMVLFYDQWVEVKGDIVPFVDICGIIDHHCLNFLFIIVNHSTAETLTIFKMNKDGLGLWQGIEVYTSLK